MSATIFTASLNAVWTWLPLLFSSATAPVPKIIDATVPANHRTQKCVHIYYDRAPTAVPRFDYGRIHALFLQNLISHFSGIQQYIIPVEAYQKGQLDECGANFYMGTYFDNALPADFLQDYLTSHSQNVWMGYNIWKLSPAEMAKTLNANYSGLSTLDWNHLDPKGEPGFYRYYDYRGETFTKISRWSDPKDSGSFQAAFEIALIQLGSEKPIPQVLSWAKHSSSEQKTPYIIRNKNYWYMAESPFSFIHLSDRYLILADLLFDVLDEKPLYPNKKPALVRFEDIHVKLPQWQLQSISRVTQHTKTPVGISLIPVFADPLMYLVTDPKEKRIPATHDAQFVKFLQDLEKSGSAIIWHGLTHQLGEEKNPYTGMSGADCEFWDCVNNVAVKSDSPTFVVNRLEEGLAVFEQAKLKIAGWLTPHYSSSPLDNLVFAQLFDWNIGRENYALFTSIQKEPLPSSLNFQHSGSPQNGKRLVYFESLSLNLQSPNVAAQFLPYESYGDAYGIRLIPENTGFIQPGLNPEIGASDSVDHLLAIMKRNRVLRDVWASFFLHPFLFNDKANGGIGATAGDTTEIERLIQTTKSYGYEFIDLNAWRKTHGTATSLRPKEVFLEP